MSEIGRRISGLGKLEAAFNVVGAGPERIYYLALSVSIRLDAVRFEHLRLGHATSWSLEFRRITSC